MLQLSAWHHDPYVSIISGWGVTNLPSFLNSISHLGHSVVSPGARLKMARGDAMVTVLAGSSCDGKYCVVSSHLATVLLVMMVRTVS